MTDFNDKTDAPNTVSAFTETADVKIQSPAQAAQSGHGTSDADHAMTIPEEIALLPLRDMVVFPVLVSPVAVSRESSVRLIDEAVAAGSRIIGVTALRDPTVEKPGKDDLYPIGCAVVIRMMAKAPDGI